MTSSLQTPFARLVLFTIFLSVAGSVVAGVYYFAVVQPDQKADRAPINQVCDYNTCVMWKEYWAEEYRKHPCPTCPNVAIPDPLVCGYDPCAYKTTDR